MTTPILKTKLFIPQIQHELVPRPGLIRILNKGLAGKLTLLSAPAGFGKTTLLREWIGQANIPFGWISLDENDNDTGRFLAYLIASLRSIELDIDEQLPKLLQAPQRESLEAVLVPLINQVAEAEIDFALALDDYQVIQSEDIHSGLTFLTANLPSNMHLVIATRADPPFPLARLRARRELTEIREAQLRFSIQEGKRLLNRGREQELSDETIQVLIDRTDGWVAALQMISLAIKGRADAVEYIRNVSGSQDYIADFLTSEVISQQPEAIQDFLLKTSILDRLSGALCDTITGNDNGQQTLKQLREQNVFLFSLDDESHWYRYHRLIADLLQHRLLETQPEIVPDIYLRASLWCEKNGLPNEAIEYSLRGGHTSRAVSLVEGIAEAILIQSEIATFIRWIERLPEESVRENPALCIFYAWAQLMSGVEPGSASIHLDEIRPEDTHTSGRLNAVKAMHAQWSRQNSAAISFGQQALKQLPEEDFFFRNIAAWILSAALVISGDTSGGFRMLEEVAETSRANQNYLVAIVTTCRLAAFQMQQGYLHRAQELFEQALALGSENRQQRLPVASEAMMGLGKIFWEWHQLESASRWLDDGITLSRRWRNVTSIDSYIALAHIKQSQGDAESANRMIVEAMRLAAKTSATEADDRYVASQQAQMWVRQRNLQAALDWAAARRLEDYLGEKDLSPPPFTGADILLQYELIVFARILLASKRYREASQLLDRLLPSIEQLAHKAKTIEVYILRSLTLRALEDMEAAVTSLSQALSLAEPGGYLRIFLDEGVVLADLIREFFARGYHAHLATKLKERFLTDQADGIPSEKSQDGIEPLTEREMEVLRYLRSELTVPEIADHLHIAVSTLRTHIKNIYSKLGVHSRYEAIIKGFDGEHR